MSALNPQVPCTAEVSTGTTIVACTFRDGVVLGADGRVSVGNYISNRSSNKIQPLADHVYLLRSGSAPDTQAIGDYVRYFVEQLGSEMQGPVSVATIAKLVSTMNYNNKDNLVGAMIVAGYDEQAGGQVFGCPISGTLVPEKWAIDGSGSTYIWALCDADYRDGMSRDEAEKWVTDAISLALARDSSSGGCIRLVTITKDGAAHKYISGDKVPLWLEDEPAPAPGGAAAAAAAAGMVLG